MFVVQFSITESAFCYVLHAQPKWPQLWTVFCFCFPYTESSPIYQREKVIYTVRRRLRPRYDVDSTDSSNKFLAFFSEAVKRKQQLPHRALRPIH